MCSFVCVRAPDYVCVGSPEMKISPESKPQVAPWALSPFGFFPQGLHAVLSRGRGARKGDGRICEWCLCAWRLSLADVKEEVSGVRRKAIYGKEL